MARTKKPEIIVPSTITGNSELDKRLVEMPEATNKEALETALLLQQLIRGQEAILNNQNTMGDELRKLRGRMDEYDIATEKFEQDKEKYLEEVRKASEAHLATGSAKDKIIANGVQRFQEEVALGRANLTTERLQFEEIIARMPKVKVTVPGKIENYMNGGHATPTLVGEEIRIKHKVWYLPPGVEVEVPEIVATALKERRRIEAENDQRSKILSQNLENNQLIAEMKKIDERYGVVHAEE